MELTEREKWIAEASYVAGHCEGIQRRADISANEAFKDWLRSGGPDTGETIEQFLANSAPESQ